MALTDLARRNPETGKTLKKLSDGGELQLWLPPTGSKPRRLAYRFEGKQKRLAIGPDPLISLAEAREARDQAKKLLLAGRDPLEDKRAAKIAASALIAFRHLAKEYVEKLKLADEDLGGREAASIKTADLFPVLQAVELSGRREPAKRRRSAAGAVFRYGIATGVARTIQPSH